MLFMKAAKSTFSSSRLFYYSTKSCKSMIEAVMEYSALFCGKFGPVNSIVVKTKNKNGHFQGTCKE